MSIMKGAIIVVAVVLGVYFLDQALKPPQSVFPDDFPPDLRKHMEGIMAEAERELNSDFGRGAIDVCRHRLGIKERAKTSVDVLRLGYDVDKANAFALCVANVMYPVK